jgi:hypothetical protein
MDLVRRGLDLREVAQELFLTPGSVRATLEAASGPPVTGSSLPQVRGPTVSSRR